MDHEMKVVCAWCQGHIRGPEQAERVSHGICVSCREREETSFHQLTEPTDGRTYEEWVDLGGEG